MMYKMKSISLIGLMLIYSTLVFAQTVGGSRPPTGFRTDLSKFKKPIELGSPILKNQMKVSVALSKLKNLEGDLLEKINNNSPQCTSTRTSFKNLTEMHSMLALGKQSSNKNDIPDCYNCSLNKDPTDNQAPSLASCFALLPEVRDDLVNFMNDEFIKVYLNKEYRYDSKQVDYFYEYYNKLFEQTNKVK